jgi:hypothetical protein
LKLGGERLKKKLLFAVISILALSAIMVISAAITYNLSTSMNANIAEAGSVTVTVDSTTYNTGDSLSINWGTVTPGQTYTKAVTIHNSANIAITPSLTNTLPSTYGTISLSSASPIPMYSDATVNIVFQVAATAPAGAVPSWTAAFSASS